MAVTQRTINYDDAFTASADKVWPGVVDQVKNSNPATEYLTRQGRTKESGGNVVEIMIRRALNTTVSSYELFGTINTDRQNDLLTIAHQNRRYIAGSIRYSPEEEGINSGDEKLADLVTERIEALETDMKEYLSGQLWQFSAGNSGFSPDPIPLAIISDPTAATSFMGIDPSLETYWRNQRADSAATTFNGLKREISSLKSLITRRGGNPDVAICDYETWLTLENALGSLVRIPDKDSVHYGYKADGMLWGNMMIFADRNVPDAQNQILATGTPTAGTVYCMDSKYIRLEYVRGLNMKKLPWQMDANGSDRAMKVLLALNLVVTARRFLGQLENISQTITA